MSFAVIALLLAGQVAPSSPSQAQSADPARDIVVTGRSLAETERALKDCRARHCPPDQEIDAALAHGENLFVAGHYSRSRGVLNATIDHTRGAEKHFPIAVGDLRRAEARVASHLGEDDEVRRGMLASKDALASGLGKDDPRVLAQRLQVADAMLLREPRPRTNIGDARPLWEDWRYVALRTYNDVAHDAHRLDLPNIEGRALIRRASLLVGLATVDPTNYRKAAREALDRIAATTDPRLSVYRDAARLLVARQQIGNGDPAAVERLVATVGPQANRTPVLVYAPAIDWSKSRDHALGVTRRLLTQIDSQEFSLKHEDEWIDVGFDVLPDGRVGNVEALRESAGRRSDWVEPVLAAIRARRYAPTALPAGSPGMTRVERHTYTAGYENVTRSRFRAQNGLPRVVVTDMTVEPPAPAVTGAGSHG